MSNSLPPHGLEPTRLLCPWDFPGKSIGVGCHILLQGNLSHPGIKPTSPASSPRAGRFSTNFWGFPGGSNGKVLACQSRRCKRLRFDPWVRKIPWRRVCQPTSVFLPGESHGWRDSWRQSLRELDTTEVT